MSSYRGWLLSLVTIAGTATAAVVVYRYATRSVRPSEEDEGVHPGAGGGRVTNAFSPGDAISEADYETVDDGGTAEEHEEVVATQQEQQQLMLVTREGDLVLSVLGVALMIIVAFVGFLVAFTSDEAVSPTQLPMFTPLMWIAAGIFTAASVEVLSNGAVTVPGVPVLTDKAVFPSDSSDFELIERHLPSEPSDTGVSNEADTKLPAPVDLDNTAKDADRRRSSAAASVHSTIAHRKPSTESAPSVGHRRSSAAESTATDGHHRASTESNSNSLPVHRRSSAESNASAVRRRSSVESSAAARRRSSVESRRAAARGRARTNTDEEEKAPAPSEVAALVSKTEELFEQNRHGEIRDLLKASLRPLANDVEVLWRLARACNYLVDETSDHEQKKELAFEGLSYAEHAFDINPNSAASNKWMAIMTSSVGNFRDTKDKIAGAYVIRDHIKRAIELDPHDSTSHNILGQWCLAFADLSWFEKKAAAALFGAPPSASYEEAVQHFLNAENLSPGFWKKNSFLLAQTYMKMKNEIEAAQWVMKAKAVPVKTAEDEEVERDIAVLMRKLRLPE